MDYSPWFEYLDYDENAIYVKARTGIGEEGKGSINLSFTLKTSESTLPPQTVGATIKQTLAFTGTSSLETYVFDDLKYQAILTGINAASASGLDNLQQLMLQLSAENKWNLGPFSITLSNYVKAAFNNELGMDNISIPFGTKGTFTITQNLGDLADLEISGIAELVYIPTANNQASWSAGGSARLINVDVNSGWVEVLLESIRVGYNSTNGINSASGIDNRVYTLGFQFEP